MWQLFKDGLRVLSGYWGLGLLLLIVAWLIVMINGIVGLIQMMPPGGL